MQLNKYKAYIEMNEYYKKKSKVMLSPVKVQQELKDGVIGVSSQKQKNYTDTMIYLLELGINAHLMQNMKDGPITDRKEFEPKREEEKPKKAPAKRFVKPDEGDIYNHMIDKGMDQNSAFLEANKFFNYYESNGWKVGKNSMKNWKAATVNWMKNNYSTPAKADKFATPDRTELFNEMGVGQDAPFYNPLAIEGD